MLGRHDIPKTPRQRSWRWWAGSNVHTIDTATDDRIRARGVAGGGSSIAACSMIRIPAEHATELGEGYAQ